MDWKHGALFVILLQLGGFQITRLAASDEEAFFEKQVRPLLVERCHKCHAGKMSKGGLRLDSREALMKGGESGIVLVAGKPEESRLMEAVKHETA